MYHITFKNKIVPQDLIFTLCGVHIAQIITEEVKRTTFQMSFTQKLRIHFEISFVFGRFKLRTAYIPKQ